MTITLAFLDRTDDALINPTIRATVNATGETVYEWSDFGAYYEFGFAGGQFNPTITNPADKRGNVFFEWDSGREPGVSYIVPTATGFESGLDRTGVEHSLAHVVDSDGDGNYEIEQGFQVCTTSCADGYYYTHIWTWDGSAYTGSDVDPNLSPEDSAQIEAAKQSFNDFLLAVGARDYERAWAMLTPSCQEQLGDFEGFTGYWDGFEKFGIDNIHAYKRYEPSNPNAVTGLDVQMWYELDDGSRETGAIGATLTDDDPPKIDSYESF